MRKHQNWLGYFWIMVIGALFFTLTACNDKVVYEDVIEIGQKAWTYEQVVDFEVEMRDTTAKYDVLLNIRHTNEYAYSNLWVWIYTSFPSGKLMKKRVDLPLADKQGKWYGNGSGEIISTTIAIQENAIFPEIGKYSFKVEQNMRVNPLEEVMDVGLMIEKRAETTEE